jgi:outer membrane protein assembly factor BamB
VWVGSEDGTLYGIAPDGGSAWAYKTEGPISSSPAIGSLGEVAIGSRDHYVYLFR